MKLEKYIELCSSNFLPDIGQEAAKELSNLRAVNAEMLKALQAWEDDMPPFPIDTQELYRWFFNRLLNTRLAIHAATAGTLRTP